MNPSFYNLYTMTAARIASAGHMAKEGKKDEARNWLNFIQQAGLLRILQEQGYDIAKMTAAHAAGMSMAHPQNDNSPTQDEYQSLKQEVKRLAGLVEKSTFLQMKFAATQTGGDAGTTTTTPNHTHSRMQLN